MKWVNDFFGWLNFSSKCTNNNVKNHENALHRQPEHYLHISSLSSIVGGSSTDDVTRLIGMKQDRSCNLVLGGLPLVIWWALRRAGGWALGCLMMAAVAVVAKDEGKRIVFHQHWCAPVIIHSRVYLWKSVWSVKSSRSVNQDRWTITEVSPPRSKGVQN